jgi:hypothetical protein
LRSVAAPLRVGLTQALGAVNKIAATYTTLFLAILMSGCTSQLRRETPIGHACYRSFSYEPQPRYYKCLFELSAPSAFYDDREINKILEAFMANEGGVCEKGPERDIADVRTQAMDHGLRYRLFGVTCRYP